MGKAHSHTLAVTKINPEHGGRIIKPNNNDVLCGRGGRVNAHQGNIRYRLLVSEHKHLYLAKTRKKLDKANIAALVVSKIRQLSPPGRFLKEDESHGLWVEIGDVKATKKAGQALREDAPDLRSKSDGEESLASSPVAPAPSGIPMGPFRLDKPYHPIQQLDVSMGNHNQFPNLSPQTYIMPISEGSGELHENNKSLRTDITEAANQHVNQEDYYSNPVQVYYPTHLPASMHTSNQLQSVLVPQQTLQQQNQHNNVSPSNTFNSQDYRTCETDSTSNDSGDYHNLSRMENTISIPKIPNRWLKSNILQPDDNDQNKRFSLQVDQRDKFHHHVVSPLDTYNSQDYMTGESDSTSNDIDDSILSMMENTTESPKILNPRVKSNKWQPDHSDQNKSLSMRVDQRENFHHHLVSPPDAYDIPDHSTCETESTSSDSLDSHIISRIEHTTVPPNNLNHWLKSNKLQPDNSDQNKSIRMRMDKKQKFHKPAWKNSKSIEFPQLEKECVEDDFIATLSFTSNEDVADSKRTRMGQCESSNEIFNSNITSSCYSNINKNDLSTCFPAQSLTRSVSSTPSSISLTDTSFFAFVEDLFCADD